MEFKNSKPREPKFFFHCYSFKALYGLEEIRSSISNIYGSHVPNFDNSQRACEAASKTLNTMVHNAYYLQDGIDEIKINEAEDRAYSEMYGFKPSENEQPDISKDVSKIGLKSMGWDSMKNDPYDDSEDTDNADIEKHCKDPNDPCNTHYGDYHLLSAIMEREDLVKRLKKAYGSPYIPQKESLNNNLKGFKESGVDPSRFIKRTMQMHLSHAFWSDPYFELSFQCN